MAAVTSTPPREFLGAGFAGVGISIGLSRLFSVCSFATSHTVVDLT